ncbi:MAG: hypothetical protein Q9218_007754, partial [Villophora microphyllina]
MTPTLVWKAIVERRVKLPVVGESADGLWNHCLELGFDDPEILKEIFLYARILKEDHGRAWPALYVTVVGHHLRAGPRTPTKAWLCHARLRKHFPPSNEQLQQLLALVIYDDELRQVFLRMHKDFPFARIYDDAIPELCKQGLLAMAILWHRKLFARGDLPSDPKSAEPVLQHLAHVGDKIRLMKYSQLMAAAGISSKKEVIRKVDSSRPTDNKELMNQVAETPGTPNPDKRFYDHFSSRLFATEVFCLDTIISTLVFLNTVQIGPLALRELAARELSHNPFHRALQRRLDQLKEGGISIGQSAFSIVVSRLVKEGNDDLLRNVITCNLHPDTFEDEKLQELLLSSYQEQHDTIAFNRTLATLTAKIPSDNAKALETRRWNLILRCYLTRRELPGVKGVLEKMKDHQMQIEPRSTAYVNETLLSRRQVGRRAASTKELNLLIRIWQDALLSGGAVPPGAWVEILKRLGMSGRLVTFERLALWLATWYSSQAFQISQTPMLQQNTRLLPPPASVQHKAGNPLHPAHAIFPISMLQGIVAWGPTWTWGLLLLRKLRDRNVHVPEPA